MSTLSRSEEKIRLEDLQHYDQEDISYCSLTERPDSPGLRGHHGAMEQEKRIRREIANSNERRRMQSINAGFQSLRTLLPHHEGEKLSKAAILQQTAEYIYQLEQEKTRLLSQNCQLKRLINQHEGETNSTVKKRKTESGMVVTMAEGVSPDPVVVTSGEPGAGSPALLDMDQAAANSELIDLRVQLDRERGLRMILEEQVRSLETQLYPERIREITQQVQLQFSQHQEDDCQPGLLTPLRRESQSSTGSETQEAATTVATLQVVSAASLQPVSHTETVIATTPSPPTTPTPASATAPAAPNTPASRLPTILEAAIKAEPKVDIERLSSSPSGGNGEEVVPQARVYVASTSRQNLETIVEAIRHLEGDAFNSVGATERSAPTQQTPLTPLALTKQQRLLKVEMNPFLQFHPPPTQQQRPGVIVVKQHT